MIDGCVDDDSSPPFMESAVRSNESGRVASVAAERERLVVYWSAFRGTGEEI